VPTPRKSPHLHSTDHTHNGEGGGGHALGGQLGGGGSHALGAAAAPSAQVSPHLSHSCHTSCATSDGAVASLGGQRGGGGHAPGPADDGRYDFSDFFKKKERPKYT
jgi:hypothetical protein